MKMKYIIAVIKPSHLDKVHEALTNLDVPGLTVSEVRGYGRQRGETEIYRGAEYSVAFAPKVKLEIAIEAKAAKKVVSAIRESASTDNVGDGKIFVLDLVDALRINTNQTGIDALN
jgi:nitrogen regulatory protein P-II 2